VSDGLLLIGDAAGYLDAITGEGISMALAQALALRETVIPLLHRQEGVLRRQDLLQYQKAYRTIVRPYYLFTHLMLWLSRHQALGERVIGILHTHPGLFQKLLSASMGATKIRSRGIPTSPDY
jgi:flavin-dependent dehydrogenase